MQKIISRSFITLILVFLLYIVLWFIAAITVKNKILTVFSELKPLNFVISYDNEPKLAGFPGKISLKFSNFKFEHITQKRFVISADELNLKTDILAKNISIEPGKLFNIETAEHNSSLSYNELPILRLKFYNPILFISINDKLKQFWQNIEEVMYKDSGYKLTDNETKFVYYNAKNCEVLINLLNNNNEQTMHINYNANAENIVKQDEAPVNLSFATDININIVKDTDNNKNLFKNLNFDINNFNLKADDITLIINGNFASSPAAMMPVGQALVKIQNYNKLLGYIFRDSPDYINVTSELIKKIANLKVEDNDANFVIKHEINNDFKIGNMSFSEVIAFYTLNKK